MRRVPAPILVLAAIASVQFGSAVARGLFDDLGAAGVTFLRLAIAALILAALTRPKVWTWSFAAWRAAALLGLAMGSMNLVFYYAIRSVPLGTAVTVEFLGPLLLALVQTRRLLDLFWAALAGAGVVLLGLHSGGAAPLSGLMLALLAGLCWAAYIVCSARVGALIPGTGGLTVSLAIGALLVAPFGLSGAAAVVDHPHLLLGAAGVALLSSVISYGLELNALRRIPTRVFGILMSLEPGGAALAGLLVLGQRLGPVEVAALVLVTLASVGVTLARRTPVEQPEAVPVEADAGHHRDLAPRSGDRPDPA